MSEPKGPHLEPEISGWLYKWTNYLKGYQKRWFVLSNGLLSYYRNQEEMRHTCRGSVSLQNAIITTTDHCSFTISNGGNQIFHIRASTEKERQTWLTALTLAKKNRPFDSEDEDEITGSGESLDTDTANLNKLLASKLEELQACNDILPKHLNALQRSLTEIENVEGALGSVNLKELKERAILFRITTTAMVNKGLEFNDFAQSHWKKWQKAFQHERDQRQRLEEMVEQLARQHSHLERAAARQVTSGDEDEEIEFFDAQGDEDDGHDKNEFVLNCKAFTHRRTESGTSQEEASGSSSEAEGEDGSSGMRPLRSKRAMTLSGALIPETQMGLPSRFRRKQVPDKPHHPLNLWSIMKNCIGKELTKIPMPVNFSEPLSMLQRLTEDYEYAAILDKAASCVDTCEQLAYVAAFTVSSYSTTANRTAKPFNPLLGETYECDRTDDLGWRSVSEQVSHHPPMFAQYCEGKQWKAWQEFTMASKFRGKYLQVIPLGISHLTFNQTRSHYTWRKVTTTVHNIIVGKLWVDQHGDMDITNHGTGDVCHITFLPYSYFNSGNQRKVKGYVKSAEGQVKWVLSGTWDQKIEIASVLSESGDPNNPTFKTGPYSLAWEVKPPNPGCERFYNFSELACQLNEVEEGVAPTDSRLRPDQRLMEEGDWNGANVEKVRLEEKQRGARRNREANEDSRYDPVWFNREEDPVTGGYIHIYTREYWDCKARQDWAKCPDIF